MTSGLSICHVGALMTTDTEEHDRAYDHPGVTDSQADPLGQTVDGTHYRSGEQKAAGHGAGKCRQAGGRPVAFSHERQRRC